ncbi:MAG: hypothetical protein Q9222_002828, partial [Ikaeria aurantiellina]
SLRRQHKRRNIIESEIDARRVRERVDAVDGRGDPDDEHRQKKEEGDAGVEPGARVRGFVHRGGAGEFANAENVGFGWAAVVCGLADLDVDGVGVGFQVGGLFRLVAMDAVEVFVEDVVRIVGGGLGGRLRGWFNDDVDVGCHKAGEGVFVEGVEEAFELGAALIDDAAGFNVDAECEGDSNPVGGQKAGRTGVCSWKGPESGRERFGGLPYNAVEESNTEEVPFDVNPTPKLDTSVSSLLTSNLVGTHDCWTVDFSPSLGIDKQEGQGRHERSTITAQQIPLVQRSQLACRILVEEGEIDIPSHTARPEGVNAQEPALDNEQFYSIISISGVLHLYEEGLKLAEG